MKTGSFPNALSALIACCIVFSVPCGAQRYEVPPTAAAGDSVSNVLVSLQHLGLPLLFSTNLVSPELTLSVSVAAPTHLALAEAVLKDFGLEVVVRGEFYVVTRIHSDTSTAISLEPPPAKIRLEQKSEKPRLEHVAVTASLYRLFRNVEASAYQVDQSKLELVPTVGEDTLRSLQRLPGIATQGISSQLRVRGSTVDDTTIFINGHRLSQPFHVRDYQSLFSAIDPRIADPIRAYTGGYPVEYGNSLQGLVLIESVKPQEYPLREFGMSLFTTSVLYSDELGSDGGHWLVSARKGNLDWILDAAYGEPKFYDVFLELDIPVGDRTQFSLNALTSRDEVFLSTESDPDEDETSRSTIDNDNIWLGISREWNQDIRSTTTFSFVDINSDRQGVNRQEGKLEGYVSDIRSSRKFALNHQWRWSHSEQHTVLLGFDYSYQSADYRYRADAVYGEDYLLYQSVDESISTDLNIGLAGESAGVFISDTWSPNSALQVSLGARWDKYTYSDLPNDRNLLSPRVGINYKLDDRSTVSFSAGRYYQSQDINLLQIEDAQTRLNSAQRSDQFIAGLQHNYSDALAFRLEAYRNVTNRIAPRYENVNDPLALIPEFEPDRVRLAPDKARAKGVEFSVNYDNGTPWSSWFNYAWSRTEDRIDGNWRPRSWNQRHSVQAGFSYESERWSLSAALGAHSGWPTTALELVQDPNSPEVELRQQLYNGDLLNDFVSVDMHIARTYSVGRGELRTFFELTNAFNRKNACCVDYSPEEVGTSIVLDGAHEYGLPLLPSIGFLWKF